MSQCCVKANGEATCSMKIGVGVVVVVVVVVVAVAVESSSRQCGVLLCGKIEIWRRVPGIYSHRPLFVALHLFPSDIGVMVHNSPSRVRFGSVHLLIWFEIMQCSAEECSGFVAADLRGNTLNRTLPFLRTST